MTWDESVCRKKRRYKSQSVARRAVIEVINRRGALMEPYRCGCCGRWHLRTVHVPKRQSV